MTSHFPPQVGVASKESEGAHPRFLSRTQVASSVCKAIGVLTQSFSEHFLGSEFFKGHRPLHSLGLWVLSPDLGPANRAALQAMEESFPERPALFFDFVLPSRSEDLFSNLWIADPHRTTPMWDGLENCEEVPRNDSRLDFAAKHTNVAIRQFTHGPGCGVVGEMGIFANYPRRYFSRCSIHPV